MAQIEYLTTDEAAERLRVVTKKTLANWRSRGEGPPFSRFGGRVLYPLEKFERWELAQQATSTGDYGKNKGDS